MWWYNSLRRNVKLSISLRSLRLWWNTNQMRKTKVFGLVMEESISIVSFVDKCQSWGIILHIRPHSHIPRNRMECPNQLIGQSWSVQDPWSTNYTQVDKKWWAEAVYSAPCSTSSVPCAAHPNKAPCEMCYKQSQTWSIYEYLERMASRISILSSARKWTQRYFDSCIFENLTSQKGFECGTWTTKELGILGRRISRAPLE